jgi:hypothetical protein
MRDVNVICNREKSERQHSMDVLCCDDARGSRHADAAVLAEETDSQQHWHWPGTWIQDQGCDK